MDQLRERNVYLIALVYLRVFKCYTAIECKQCTSTEICNGISSIGWNDKNQKVQNTQKQNRCYQGFQRKSKVFVSDWEYMIRYCWIQNCQCLVKLKWFPKLNWLCGYPFSLYHLMYSRKQSSQVCIVWPQIKWTEYRTSESTWRQWNTGTETLDMVFQK